MLPILLFIITLFQFLTTTTLAAVLIPAYPLKQASEPELISTTSTPEIKPITVPTRGQEAINERIEQKLPFLKGIDDMNRHEFFTIIRNGKLSKAEIWERVEKWAEKQSGDVQADIVEFHQRLSKHVESSKSRVERIIQNLPVALKRLSDIVQDIDITRVQEKNRIANLYTSLDEDVSKTLQWIVQLVSYEKNEGKDLETKMKLRKLKKGGIWKGAVQASNII